MTIPDEVTSKVIEALALEVQESSLAKEIAKIDGQIKALMTEKDKLERARGQTESAARSAQNIAKIAKEAATQAERAVKEAQVWAEKTQVACKEAQQFATLAQKPIDFDTPIGEAIAALSESQSNIKDLSHRLAEIKNRRSALKREGIDISPHGDKVTRTTVI